MSTATPNAELAYRVLDHIDAHPAQWNQHFWLSRPDGQDCGTAGCFAGWVSLLSGDRPTWPYRTAATTDFVVDDEGEKRYVDSRAVELLGIDEEDAEELFCATNTRADLGRFVAEFFGPRPKVTR